MWAAAVGLLVGAADEEVGGGAGENALHVGTADEMPMPALPTKRNVGTAGRF